MVGLIVFHVVMLLLGAGIIGRVVPVQLVSNALGYVHKSIGITTPPPELTRIIALVWLGSTVVIVDGCLALLLFIASLSKPG